MSDARPAFAGVTGFGIGFGPSDDGADDFNFTGPSEEIFDGALLETGVAGLARPIGASLAAVVVRAVGVAFTAGVDFNPAFSPERIDPGNARYTFENTPKVVSGIDEDSRACVAEFYGALVETVVPVGSVLPICRSRIATIATPPMMTGQNQRFEFRAGAALMG